MGRTGRCCLSAGCKAFPAERTLATTERDEEIESLVRALKKALRHGCRASRLLEVPELLALLYPTAAFPWLSELDKAVRAEAQLRRAVEAYGGEFADAMLFLMGLAAGVHGATLARRRAGAAALADSRRAIAPDTFRRWREPSYLRDVAVGLSTFAKESP